MPRWPAWRRRASDYPGETLGESWISAAVDALLSGGQDTALWCALRAYQADPHVLSQVGFLLLYRDNPDEAKGFLLRAPELDPQFAPALISLGFLCEQAGDLGRATYSYRRLVAPHRETPHFGFPLARAYAAAGQGAAARAAPEPAAPVRTP